nr:RNA-directed DNA polymerase, eukaryota, reverse transcriptase zinc-binding domain protein [Tanacetum cinerariifolium]
MWINSKFDGQTGEGLAQKAKKDWVNELCVKNKVNFLALQETKMENMELFSVKMCWGNFVFDYVHSYSVGNSRGILCVWDPNSFCKSNATVSDYFIMIRGVWRQTGNDILIIAVYAPHDLKDKHMLWDYLTYEIGKWKGEVVIMGDFNEVRYKLNRFGSVFNVQGANVFNLFITNAGLEEVPLDSRMEKKNMLSAKNVKAKYKDELKPLEAIIDKGDGNVEVVNKRMEVVNTLQKIDKICSSEMAQKAKVKWSIKEDENNSFFHGMLNKKRSLLNIWGIMVDGMWIENPNRVKGEFFHHFSSRFDKPDARQAHIEMRYPKTLTCDQQVELESDVSNEDIKRAVWDRGIDKFPVLDGFTFDTGIFKGIKLSSSLSISHMFYADDVVFVGQWCDGNITTLVHVLKCFYWASGLRINMSKSKIMGVLVDSDKVKCVASKLGCLILKTPFLYLGSKVGGSMSRVHTWNEVVDRVKKRLSRWKMKTLSIGGRLTLLNKKASWVNWKKVLALKEKGGLGVSSLYALNRGLMFKWMWRFYTQNTSLWVRVIKAIHGDDGKVGGYVKDGAKSCWLSIVNEINSLKNKGKALKNGYPRIYSLETCKLITVCMKLAQTSLDSSFRRALESSGDFSVASVRKVIDDKSLPKVDSKTRWIKYVPIKVNVHAWKVKTDSLPTRFNVSHRGIHIDSIMCAICDKGAETSSHLFFSCCMARQTVRLITHWWDVPYGEVDSYEDWINWFMNLRLSYKHKQMLEGVFYVKWWLLWKFRNKLMFDSIPPSQELFFDDVVSMFLGCPNIEGQRCSYFHWLDPPMCQRAMLIIPGLLRARNMMEADMMKLDLLLVPENLALVLGHSAFRVVTSRTIKFNIPVFIPNNIFKTTILILHVLKFSIGKRHSYFYHVSTASARSAMAALSSISPMKWPQSVTTENLRGHKVGRRTWRAAASHLCG